MTDPQGPLEQTFEMRELLDVIESLLAFSRAATFDEAEGEYEVYTRARTVLERYRSGGTTDAQDRNLESKEAGHG